MKLKKQFISLFLIFSTLLLISPSTFAQNIKNYTVIAHAVNNTSLQYDIKAYKTDDGYNFILPYSCDIKNVNISVYSEDNSKILDETCDFSDNLYKKIAIDLENFILVSAFNSTLPVMYINIDESHGTIDAMNQSEEHTECCYGDMVLDVPLQWRERLNCEGFLSTVENDGDPKQPGTIRLRGRGNSSWSLAKDKQRPYQLKLEKGLNLLGMGKNKEWALLRSDTNLKYLFNKTAYDMAADFGIKNTPRAEMTDVFLNGKYIGMYTLANTVKINSGSVPITNLDDKVEEGLVDELDLTGGYLLEIDNFDEPIQFKAQHNRITIKSPENLDSSIDSPRYDYIKNLMSDLFNAVYGNGYLSDGRHFGEVLDLDSAVRYFLHQEMIGNYDCCQGSTYFYKDVDSVNSKIYMGPVWDCDLAFDLYANEWCLTNRVSYWEPHQSLFFAELCKHKEFFDRVIAYYFDNMNNNNIRTTFLGYADKIDEYAMLYDKSIKATSIIYDLPEPVYSHLSSYISQKHKFFEQNLRRKAVEATRGNKSELFDVSNSPAFCDITIQNSRLYYSYENTTAITKNILILTYNKQNKLTSVNRIEVKPNSTIHSYLYLPDTNTSKIKALDDELYTFTPVNATNYSYTPENTIPDFIMNNHNILQMFN